MRIYCLKSTGALSLLAVIAWGAVWFGPAGGWTRTGGGTGYLHTTEYPVIHDRNAAYWGLAGGWKGSGLRVAGRTSFLPGDAADRVPSTRLSYGGDWLDYSYKESGADITCDRRFLAGAVSLRLGGRASWAHAFRRDTYYSFWNFQEPADSDGIVVNDLFVGPSVGWEANAGKLLFGVTVAPGWRRHHESISSSAVVHFPNGSSTKEIVERRHDHDYVAAHAELAATWRVADRFAVGAWAEGRQDLYLLSDGDDDTDPRWDIIFGVTPAVYFP